MNAEAPWVRIVIVNYNAGAMLQACVDSLSIQTMAAFEAVIVDNGSTDRPVTNLELPDGRFGILPAGGNLGFAAASNLGARGAAGPWLAMLNPDTRPRQDWLAELRAATERHPWARMFGSTQLSATDPTIADGFGDILSAYGAAWRTAGGRPAVELPEMDCEVFSPCAAAALYATPAFLASGGFDERFFCYLEDVDLGFRLRLQGERCVQVRHAEVLHEGSAVAGYLSDFAVYHSYRNRLWLSAKNVPWPLLPAILPLQAAAIAFALARRPPAFRRAAFKGLRAGLNGLPEALSDRKDIQRMRTVTSAAVARMLVWSPFGRQVRLPYPIPPKL